MLRHPGLVSVLLKAAPPLLHMTDSAGWGPLIWAWHQAGASSDQAAAHVEVVAVLRAAGATELSPREFGQAVTQPRSQLDSAVAWALLAVQANWGPDMPTDENLVIPSNREQAWVYPKRTKRRSKLGLPPFSQLSVITAARSDVHGQDGQHASYGVKSRHDQLQGACMLQHSSSVSRTQQTPPPLPSAHRAASVPSPQPMHNTSAADGLLHGVGMATASAAMPKVSHARLTSRSASQHSKAFAPR